MTARERLERDPPAPAPLPSGRPLDPAVRGEMEERFGRDLGDVRVRQAGAETPPRPRARAWTRGSLITFAPGHYAPGEPAGRRLIAHEVAHVVQQERPGGGPPGPEHEAEAEAAAAGLGGSAPARVGLASAAGAPQAADPITAAAAGAPRRRIVIDAVIIGLINRGNADVAKELLRLRGTADIWITQEGWNALVQSTNPQTAAANRRLLDELGITVGPPESLGKEGAARRLEVLTKNIDEKQILSEQRKVSPKAPGAVPKPGGKGAIATGGDVYAVAHAAAGDAELWSLDKAFNDANAAKQVEARFGVKIAPESLTTDPKPVLPAEDYRVARKLLGLEEIEIDEKGLVVPKKPPPGSGGGGGGAPPPPAKTPPPPAKTPPPAKAPAPVELPKTTPAPVELPKTAPAPVELPKTTPAPVELPKTAPAPVEMPKTTPAPVALPKTAPAPVELPEAPSVSVAVPKEAPTPTLPKGRFTPPVGDLGLDQIAKGRLLRTLFRSLGRILKVVGPIVGAALDVLDAVNAYSMAMSGMAGRGFVLTEEIKAVDLRRAAAEELLASYRAEHEAFQLALSLPVGDDPRAGAAALASLRAGIAVEGPLALRDLGARRAEIATGVKALAELSSEADVKQRAAEAYLRASLPDFGTVNKATALAAAQDWMRIRAAADASAAALRAVDAILAEQVAMLRYYSPGLTAAPPG